MYVHQAGVALEILLSGLQNNCNYQGKLKDLLKEELILVVDLWSRWSGGFSPPEAVGLFYF